MFATYFLYMGVWKLASLTDVQFLDLYVNFSSNKLRAIPNIDHLGHRMSVFAAWNRFFEILVLVIAFIISVYLSKKRKVHRLNPEIVLIVCFALRTIRFDFMWFTEKMFFIFGHLFSTYGLRYELIANGLLFVSLSMIIFFSKWTNRFIEGKSSPTLPG